MSGCSGITNQLWKKEWLQVLVSKKHNNLDHCKWRPETMTVPFKCMTTSAPLKKQRNLNRNICEIRCLFSIYGWKCFSKYTALSKEWLVTNTFVKKRRTVRWKKPGSVRLNIVPYKENNFFWNNYFTLDHSLLWASILIRFSYICK